MLPALLLAGPLGGSAHAYETDQLTDRGEPLEDAAPLADAWMVRELVAAAAQTNARTGCKGSDDHVRAVLAHEIHERVGKKVHLQERGLFRGLGYDRTMAFLEGAPGVDRRVFLQRSDIYGLARMKEAPILDVIGPSATINLGGVLVGTDKPSHFVDVGYGYFRKSHEGRDPDRAVRWGTHTENTFYGLQTSSTFSFADLTANWEGMIFYQQLLSERSPLQRDEQGCVQVVAPFRWEHWVSPEWDEVLNPSVYTAGAQAAVDRRLNGEEHSLCEDYARWGKGYPQQLAAIMGRDERWYGADSPPRSDPFHVADRCKEPGEDVAGTDSGK